LTDAQKADLKSGKQILVTGMQKKNGEKFDAKVSYNSVNKGLVFIPEKSLKKTQSQQHSAKKSNGLSQ
jgi:hypothetical protein